MKLKQLIGAIMFSTPIAVFAFWVGYEAPDLLVKMVVFALIMGLMALGLVWMNE